MPNGSRKLVMVLMDAVSYSYLDSMPFLSWLASRGKAYSVRPAPGFRGVEPILNGAWTSPGEVPFHFRMGTVSHVPLSWLAPGDAVLPDRANRVVRKLLSLVHKQEDPQMVPPWLLPHLVRSTGTNRTPRLISEWESHGKKVWWFTRDSRFERYKKWSSQVFYVVLGGSILKEVQNAIGQGNDVVYFEFSTELDRYGHQFGPDSNKTQKSSYHIDHELSDFLNRVGIHRGNVDVAVLSDHGMSRVETEVDIESVLSKHGLINGQDYRGLWNSNFAQIWGSTDAIQRILDVIAEAPGIRAVPEEERRIWFGEDPAYGDLILACDEGVVLRPNHFQGKHAVRGMHGYLDSRTAESRALCVFAGEGFTGLPDRVEVEMPELYPILAGWGRD